VRHCWIRCGDSAIREEDRREKWRGMEYRIAMGVHLHEVNRYADEVAQEM
jgi:hypothetical protein